MPKDITMVKSNARFLLISLIDILFGVDTFAKTLITWMKAGVDTFAKTLITWMKAQQH